MNHFAHDALAEVKQELGEGAVQERIAAMGMDPALALDMRTANKPYRSHDNPELERHFADTARIFANVGSGTRTPAKEVEVKGGREGYFALLRSEEFRRTYWERYPVLIKAHGALRDVLTLDQVLDDEYTVQREKPEKNSRAPWAATRRSSRSACSSGSPRWRSWPSTCPKRSTNRARSTCT